MSNAEMTELKPRSSDWWCPTCNSTKHPVQVTYEETCETCGTFIGNTRAQSPGLDRELLLQHLEVEQYKLTMLYPKSAHGIKKLCSRLKIFIKDGEFDAITTGEIDK